MVMLCSEPGERGMLCVKPRLVVFPFLTLVSRVKQATRRWRGGDYAFVDALGARVRAKRVR